jgi:hypothetical protein
MTDNLGTSCANLVFLQHEKSGTAHDRPRVRRLIGAHIRRTRTILALATPRYGLLSNAETYLVRC